MKKFILMIACAGLFCFSVSAQKQDASKVPVAVKATFAKQFPTATDVKWEKEGKEFEVAFKEKGKPMTVALDAKGTLLESETSLKTTELPASVLKYLSENFKGKTIISADKTVTSGKVTYEVVVEKGKDLVFDANGKFIKKVKE